MDKHIITLPTLRSYQVIVKDDVNLDEVRNFMATATAVTLEVLIPGETEGQSKPGKLILWGETLKNSYLTVL